MNTLAFTLGVLSVIITAFVVVLVWGVVKVVKQEKQIKTMNHDFERTISDLYRSINDNESRIYQRLSDMDRNAYEQMKNYRDENKSYTDSRLDKFIEKTGKKLIKG